MANKVSKQGRKNMAIAARKGAKARKQKAIKKYQKKPNNCATCNKILPYEKRHNFYCNSSCSAKTNNLGIRRNGNETTNRCLNCHILTRNDKYCSKQCIQDHKWEIKKNRLLKAGKVNTKCTKTARRLMIDINGHRCSICNLTTWMDGPIPLVLDHINGNSYDNRIINLRLVCGNCDMMLPTYKSKNRGNGRHKRRLRYKQGKSY